MSNTIVERLFENKQIETAKSILESNGYNVSKRLNESLYLQGDGPASEFLDILRLPEEKGGDPDCYDLIRDCAKKVDMDLSKCVYVDDINNFYEYIDKVSDDGYIEDDWSVKLLLNFEQGVYYAVKYYESKEGIKALELISRYDAYAFALVQNAR